MKTFKPYLSLLYIFFFCVQNISAQSIKQYKSIPIQEPTAISIDRQNHILVADSKGEITQYDLNGNVIYTFSPDKPGLITLLEAWQSLKVFVFYREFQEYLYLDRFLSSQTFHKVQDNIFDYFSLVSIGADNNLWAVDATNQSLLKIDLNTKTTLLTTSLANFILKENYQLNFIKEYQHKVYLNDRNTGILIFDNLGNYIKTLPYRNLSYFNFNKDEIYFLNDEDILFINLYSLEERKISLSEFKKYNYALFCSNRLFLFSKKEMSIFRTID